jgi:hypothetical protein
VRDALAREAVGLSEYRSELMAHSPFAQDNTDSVAAS